MLHNAYKFSSSRHSFSTKCVLANCLMYDCVFIFRLLFRSALYKLHWILTNLQIYRSSRINIHVHCDILPQTTEEADVHTTETAGWTCCVAGENGGADPQPGTNRSWPGSHQTTNS